MFRFTVLNSDLSNLGITKIKCGTKTFTDSPNNIVEVTVNFNEAFSTAPIVLISYASGNSGNIEWYGVTSTSKTEFKFIFKSIWTSAITRKMNWIAIQV